MGATTIDTITALWACHVVTIWCPRIIDALWIFVRHLRALESEILISLSAFRLCLYVVPPFPKMRMSILPFRQPAAVNAAGSGYGGGALADQTEFLLNSPI